MIGQSAKPKTFNRNSAIWFYEPNINLSDDRRTFNRT